MSDLNYIGGEGTTITGITVTGALDFDTAGTYYLVDCDINEVTNSSGGSVILVIDNTSITTSTDPNVSINDVNVTIVVDGGTYDTDNDKFLVDTDTVSTFTIDGFTPTEIEHTGSGSTTILGVNNAKVYGPLKVLATTITATGGSLTIGDGLEPSANYSVSAGEITLTGTEADLSGLRGLYEVDYFRVGPVYQYSTASRLVVSGTLSHDPDVEVITFANTITDETVRVSGTGVYNYGSEETLFGHTTSSTGTGLVITREDNANWDEPVFEVEDGGTFIMKGGVIQTSGTTYFNDGSIVDIKDGEIIISNPTEGQLIRSFTTNFTVDGLVKNGGALILYEAPASFSGYRPIYSDLSPQSAGRLDYSLLFYGNAQVITIRDFSGFGNPNDIGYIDNGKGILLNPVNGSATTIAGWLSGTRSDTYIEIQKEVTFNIEDSVGGESNPRVYAIDTLDANRRNQNGENNLPDNVYDATAVGGSASFTVVAGIYNAINTQTQPTDVRFSGDLAAFYFIEYDKVLSETTVSLKGNGELEVDWVLFTDTLIEEPNRATVDAYTSIDSSAQMYDRAKSYLVDNYAGETSVDFGRDGDQVSLTYHTMTLDGTPNAVPANTFAYGSDIATIKSSNFIGGATATTGKVTTENGALLGGGVFDCDIEYGSGTGTTLTNVTCSGTVTFEAGEYTLVNCDLNIVTADAAVILNKDETTTITDSTDLDITVQDAIRYATLTITSVDDANVQVNDDTGTTMVDREVGFSGEYSYTVPVLSSGTWSYCVNKAGYAPLIGAFDANGSDVNVGGALALKKQPDGSAMYTGSSSAVLGISVNIDGSSMLCNVGDGSVSLQELFDEVEDILEGQNGMTYLMNGGGEVAIANLPTGNFVFLGANVRLANPTAALNATIAAFVQSVDGTILSGSNPIQFVVVTEAAKLTEYNGAIWIDPSATDTIAAYPFGTEGNPVSSWEQAHTLSEFYNIRTIHVEGVVSLGTQDAINHIFIGGNITDEIQKNGRDVTGSTFKEMQLSGSSTGLHACEKVVLADGVNLNGIYQNCYLDGDSILEDGANVVLADAVSIIAGTASPTITHGTNSMLSLRRYSGGLTLKGSTAGCVSTLEYVSGRCTADNTNTGGVISARGMTVDAFTDNTAGATVELSALLNGVTSQSDIQTKVTRLDALVENDGGDQFTSKAMSQAPSSGGGSTTTEIYTPTSFVRTVGDDGGGGLAEIQSMDEQYAIIGETVSGLEVLATVSTSTLTQNPALVRIRGYYLSTQLSHDVAIQIWNYNTSAWETKGVMTDRSSPYDYVIPLSIDNADDTSGEMQIRFLHNDVTYKTQHSLYIDYIGFEKVESGAELASDIAAVLNNQQQLLHEHKITSDYAVAATANTITLASSASYTSGAYDPSIVKITAGTGAGQTRIILQYDGVSKVAAINRDWKELPDTSSWYVIEEYADSHSVNEGLAQGGTNNTVTLNADASSVDDVYVGQIVFLVSGLGQDQTGLITAYNGTTKVATIDRDWIINPSSITGYIIEPASPSLLSASTQAAIDDTNSKVVRFDSLIEDSGGDRFTAKSLETAPTAEMGESELHAALDSYTGKDNWKADISALSTQLSVDGLNDISIADIDARLAAYDAPTLTEMTAAFTEIKGAGWTVSDTMEAIKDGVSSGAITPSDIWTYVTRSVTGGVIDTNNDMRGTDGANTLAPDNAGVASIKAKTDQLDFISGDIKATLGGEEVFVDSGSYHSALNSYANKDQWHSDISSLATSAEIGSLDIKIVSISGDMEDVLEDTNELQMNQGAWVTASGFAVPSDVASAEANVISVISGLEAPDNSGIASIKERTDNLPDVPSSKSDVINASQL